MRHTGYSEGELKTLATQPLRQEKLGRIKLAGSRGRGINAACPAAAFMPRKPLDNSNCGEAGCIGKTVGANGGR